MKKADQDRPQSPQPIANIWKVLFLASKTFQKF